MENQNVVASNLCSATRTAVLQLSKGGPDDIVSVIDQLKAADAVAMIHVGRTDMKKGDAACVEWYAGQVLAILEAREFFAVNSIINCLDIFCPPEA